MELRKVTHLKRHMRIIGQYNARQAWELNSVALFLQIILLHADFSVLAVLEEILSRQLVGQRLDHLTRAFLRVVEVERDSQPLYGFGYVVQIGSNVPCGQLLVLGTRWWTLGACPTMVLLQSFLEAHDLYQVHQALILEEALVCHCDRKKFLLFFFNHKRYYFLKNFE